MGQDKFKIESPFSPTGDQPAAIAEITNNLKSGVKHQTLWGVTGSGKTFTMANVINNIQKPTLVIAHNKTLAAQLADEFRQFFPNNAVHYFVSYYDYYQPEAYIPQTDTYIEKDSSINDEIERLRHAATHALVSRKDVIIVASVSCIYGIGSPEFYQAENFILKVGQKYKRDTLFHSLNKLQYKRNDIELKRGSFRAKGDIIEIFPAYATNTFRVEFFGDTIEKISEIDWVTGKLIENHTEYEIFPATHFMTPAGLVDQVVAEIKADLTKSVAEFKRQDKPLEAERLEQRTNFDLEMIQETGSCSGIENYSRYFDQRKPGDPATTLIDYFPKDFLMFIDESHMTVPQIGAMFAGDLSRKNKLVEYGFRLPSAYDNRPLRFPEFYKKIDQVIFVSATPSKYEIEKSKNNVIRQFVRPTGLLDPVVEVRKTKGQIDDLIIEIEKTIKKNQRVLITTLTKRMSEELSDYLATKNIKVAYLHSDIITLERLEILHKLRLGKFDVLVGINLLREGLDLPEVSLVAILDADKEGFLRSRTSLIQVMGRAARHVEGHVIMYADHVTDSMKTAIDETLERRRYQENFNTKNNITPTSINKSVAPELLEEDMELIEIDKEFHKLSRKEKQHVLLGMRRQMAEAADNLEFERAAELRDQIVMMENKIK